MPILFFISTCQKYFLQCSLEACQRDSSNNYQVTIFFLFMPPILKEQQLRWHFAWADPEGEGGTGGPTPPPPPTLENHKWL